jgi:hypothetical protein
MRLLGLGRLVTFVVFVGGSTCLQATANPQSVSATTSTSPISVTPTTSPAAVAAILAKQPLGSRVLVLSGFDWDIALRDRVRTMPTGASPASGAPASRSTALVIPSPWPTSGSATVRARVSTWIQALRKYGSTVDAIVARPPAASLSRALAASTGGYISQLANDPRFPSLVASNPGLREALQSSASRTALALAWEVVVSRQISSASEIAHRTAVSKSFPRATFSVGSLHSVSLSAATPTSPAKETLPGPAPAAASASVAQEAPTVVSQAAPQSELSAETQGAVASAAQFVANLGSSSRLAVSGVQLSVASPEARWDRLFVVASGDSQAKRLIEDAVVAADRIVTMDRAWYRRADRFDAIPQQYVSAVALAAGANRDAVALALDDCRQADFLRSHGVTLALAVRKAGRQSHVDRMQDILRETLNWIPFQRQGWSLGDPVRHLPVGGDGVNMATSWTLIGLSDILAILGDRVPVDLRASLRAAMQRELANVVDTWVARRAWYVQSSSVTCNQWIDPNSAVIQACLYLRDQRLAPIYELAASNLGITLRNLPADGAFLEGVTYAQMSLPLLFRAVESMAEIGDDRLRSSPFLRSSWRWMLHSQMPGGNLVSCGDSRMGVLPSWASSVPLDSFALAATASGNPDALPSLRALFPGCGTWVSAASYSGRLLMAEVPPIPRLEPWGYYPSQQLITWRSAWSPASSSSREMGVWIKGGTLMEVSHGQRDQGQLSVYSGSTPILMERGTPDYGDPEYRSEFASARGHGIMQVDPIEPSNLAVNAPANVLALGAAGGRVRLSLASAYRTASRCDREVEWDVSGRVQIDDIVALTREVPADTEVYRFHLGASQRPQVGFWDGQWVVQWESATVRVASPAPITVEVFSSRNALRAPNAHYVLAIRTTQAVTGLAVRTVVELSH